MVNCRGFKSDEKLIINITHTKKKINILYLFACMSISENNDLVNMLLNYCIEILTLGGYFK